jgi:hypothetical protein
VGGVPPWPDEALRELPPDSLGPQRPRDVAQLRGVPQAGRGVLVGGCPLICVHNWTTRDTRSAVRSPRFTAPDMREVSASSNRGLSFVAENGRGGAERCSAESCTM